ncbi:putative transcriptional regulatory protein C3C7.04-like protein 2 [Colletotrichum chlorophyti]|uniref:Putative transcriptional regulatory protein C3C7.04-like protein 2 n=1 Tax=Colletotrichum chlorophyti TaxID=708187 RepID=A0A1Q8RMA0_9PEZI|nr:putative transcriptional regulatory protein C3C7.04-like protein 2 [Colletotrichum chlorophyti]
MESNVRHHGDDLWQLSRYAMSTAIEMGLHRRAAAAGDFNDEEREIRNRTWWCVYSLERQVAVITGRVLSVRDHAIDAPKPSLSSLDSLTSPEALAAPVVQRLNVKLFNHLTKLRQIGGRVLESVYIARGSDGRASRTTFQQICTEVDKIQLDLEDWKRDMETLNVKGTRERAELKVEYGLLLLLMYRPSPTFMIPSREMSPESPLLYTHGNDVAACIDLIERGTARMMEKGLFKYRNLLQSARIKVYGPSSWEPLNAQTQPTGSSSTAQVGSANTLSIFDPENLQSPSFFQAGGLETYMNQVTGYFDNSQIGLDEGLAAWFDTFMNELQSGQNRALD